MKTIEISDEMYAKLIDLATEMTTQDPGVLECHTCSKFVRRKKFTIGD